MKLGNPRCLLLLLSVVFSTCGFGQGISYSKGPARPESSPALAKGVVIGTIKSGSASQQAEMQVDDVLLRFDPRQPGVGIDARPISFERFFRPCLKGQRLELVGNESGKLAR